MAGSVACTECRRSHLKCDLQRPICARCATNRLSCTYLPSRRGGRRVPRDRQQQTAGPIPTPASPAPWATPTPTARDAGAKSSNNRLRSPTTAASMSTFGSSGYSSGNLNSHHRPPPPNDGSSTPQQQQQPYVPEARLVHLYYAHFHPAHPILVPAPSYHRQRYPDYLHQVVRFIGSHYSKVLSGDDFLAQTTLLLSRDDRSPAMVQALLLFSIIMSARNSRREAVAALARAVGLALDLGMHRADFATRAAADGDGGALLVESLRRTWWELFIWEIYLALPDGKFTSLRCSDVVSEAYLPCEEAVYNAMSSPDASPMTIASSSTQPQTFSAFRARLFSSDGGDSDHDDGGGGGDNSSDVQQQARATHGSSLQFSSYSYRIEAFYILARVMVLNTLQETHPDHLQSVVNMIVSWGHLLPARKVDVVDMYGNIDEMLFQAQFTVHHASALLHVPRSNLRPRFPTAPGSTVCPETPVRLSPSLTRHIHDVKAIEAAKELSNLLSVHSRPQGYSPAMVPGAVLAGLVQMAAAQAHASECFEHHQNRAVLVLATLTILRRQWSTAREAYAHIKAVAAENMAPAVFAAAAAAAAAASGASASPSVVGGAVPLPQAEAYGASEGRLFEDASTSAEFHASAMETAMSTGNMDHIDRIFMAGLLSPHIDQTCGEPLALSHFADFE
ncbi:Transcription factor [Cordyceps fumosorosea ARSEF 2679]|uniref:Transcription factor n=1 Tax=Cordyceps fumosorosea (strain ARSEF 2679) TaxID=1081104 RepID=A0A167V886_CORFA|nr:Transcription factor [Cordyceps fumosorosea ARSEF 2679]OAA62337.1 Transcription factor [Cordyceps fumosorosea ARSEF 2679]